ncbi:protein phosphatase 2C domain-containing protein [Candidatus Peregrinibacteria bacterium]|nr:protein phosphatase 2C domain-containing protein [Candidatus Peregrinibacteria bacterium]
MSISSIPPRDNLDTVPDNEPAHNEGALKIGEKVLLKGAYQRFEGIDLMQRSLSIFVGSKLLCTLEQNPQGNWYEFTYTCRFSHGLETLIPCPTNGQLPFRILFRAADFEMVLSDEIEERLSDSLFELIMTGEQAIHLCHVDLQKQRCWPVSYQLDDGQSTSPDSSGERQIGLQQIESGESGQLEAKMGGYDVFLSTSMEIGAGKYTIANGDNVGLNEKKHVLAIADGLGGHGNDHMASYKAVKTFLESPSNLGHAVAEASSALDLYNHFMEQPSYKVADKRPSQICDTTFIAAQLMDEDVYIVNIGDGRWFHIRDDKILAKNWNKGSIRGQLLDLGVISEKEASDLSQNPYYSEYNSLVANTLSNFESRILVPNKNGEMEIIEVEPEKIRCSVQTGDIVIGFTDGFDALTEEEILAAVKQSKGRSLSFLAEMLIEIARQKNIAISYDRTFEDGETISIRAPWDNGSLFLVRKD